MITRLLHPSDAALSRFASSAPDGATTRIRQHLADCQSCRDHVAFLRALPDRIAQLGGPEADDAMLERIRGRLAGGDRVILPVETPRRAPKRVAWVAAAAVLLVAVATWIASSASDLRAGAATGELRFAPDRLVSGPIEVTYRDAGLFAGAKRLTLRARYRTPNGDSYNHAEKQWAVATLTRGDGGGDFHATLRVPDSVVYAAFAVETADGARVDDNGHRLWYLMTREPDGRPTYDALSQRANDLMGENLELSMRVLQERTRLYADRLDTWAEITAIERFMLGDAHTDSTSVAHCQRLARFDSLLRTQTAPSLTDVAAVRSYAVQLDDRVCPRVAQISRDWRAVLQRDATASPASLSMRYSARVAETRDDPARSLAIAEEYWPRRSNIAVVLYNNGLNFAVAARDSAAMLRWADRNAEHTPVAASAFYSMIMREPRVRQAALERLRETLRRLRTRQDSLRPLERSVAEQARADSAAAREILMLIGKALVDDGKVAAGLDTLSLATRGGWEPALYRRVADIALRLGDSARALPLLARASADPATTPEAADSLSRMAAPMTSPNAWSSALADARQTMRAAVLEDAQLVPIRKSPRVQNPSGGTTDLAALTRGRTTVVVFFSRFCPPSRHEFGMLPALATRLGKESIALVAITGEAPNTELAEYLRQADVAFPLHHDTWGEAGRTFQVYGTPQYFIVDPQGRIRFRYTTLAKVLTQAMVLKDVDEEER